ncbi:sn-glycerol-3-phosphate ABC transporter substrate-binding protein UgpB [Thalassobaculum sp.]|uniref:sn-glycerol-3-phosphate ABC transporter substrate-binding protein UgpB n=1 Tax=Thalassobaculum sp. TaxID=2022740 RepID=UPI003B594CA9
MFNSKTIIAGMAGAFALSMASEAIAATEIQWWHAMGGRNGELVNEMADGFNASQSDYKVVPVYKGNYTETMTAAIAAFRAKQQPHIVQVFEVGTATMMAAEGAVYPVYKLMEDTGTAFNQDDYLPAVVSYYTTPDNKLLSLPFNSSTPVMWYNKDALDKAGAKVPSTWAEVFDASQKLVDSGMKCGFSFGWQSWVMVENFSAWHNIPMGTKENGFAGFDTEFVFNNDDVIGTLQSIADSQEKKLFQYGGRRGESLPLFTNGECGMWMNSSAYYGSIVQQAKFTFGQTMLPLNTEVADKAQNSIIGGATLWVLQGKPAAEYKGVAQFFNYISSAEVQARWHQETGYVPITTAAYELSEKQGFYEKNPGTDTAIKQLSLNTPTPNSKGIRFGNFVQVRDVINEEMEALWAGEKTAKQAMDTAVERGNDLLRKFEKAND